MTKKEERLLSKLAKLYARRKYHTWRLDDVNRQIRMETNALAQERGCIFLRPQAVEEEVARHGFARRIEKRNEG